MDNANIKEAEELLKRAVALGISAEHKQAYVLAAAVHVEIAKFKRDSK